jgi:hypothetical protein
LLTEYTMKTRLLTTFAGLALVASSQAALAQQSQDTQVRTPRAPVMPMPAPGYAPAPGMMPGYAAPGYAPGYAPNYGPNPFATPFGPQMDPRGFNMPSWGRNGMNFSPWNDNMIPRQRQSTRTFDFGWIGDGPWRISPFGDGKPLGWIEPMQEEMEAATHKAPTMPGGWNVPKMDMPDGGDIADQFYSQMWNMPRNFEVSPPNVDMGPMRGFNW